MKTSAVIVVFIVLFQGIEPRPSPGTTRRNSFVKPSQWHSDSDSDSDNEFPFDNSSDDSDDDDDNGSYSWNSSGGCPSLNEISDSIVYTNCINGKLYVNGEEIKNVKSTDSVDIISNKLRINGKFIRRISPPSSNHNFSGIVSLGYSNNGYSCPGVTQIGCVNISHHCTNGQFYINGEKITNVKSTDKVEIISNNLIINGKSIRYFPPFGGTDNNDDEDEENSGDEEDEENDDVESGEESEEEEHETESGEEDGSDEEDEIDEEDDEDGEEDDGDEEDESEKEDEGDEENEDDEDDEKYEGDEEYEDDNDDDEEDDEETNDAENEGGEDEEDEDNDDSDGEEVGDEEGEEESAPPNVIMNFCNNIYYGMKNGKFYINDFELKNYKPTDRIVLDHNYLYVNGVKLRYIKPKNNFNWN